MTRPEKCFFTPSLFISFKNEERASFVPLNAKLNEYHFVRDAEPRQIDEQTSNNEFIFHDNSLKKTSMFSGQYLTLEQCDANKHDSFPLSADVVSGNVSFHVFITVLML